MAAANKAVGLLSWRSLGRTLELDRGWGLISGPVAWFNLIDATRSSGTRVPVPSPEVALEGDTRSKFELT